MRWQYVSKIIGILVVFLGFSMIFPLLCSMIYKDNSHIAILVSMVITIFFGGIFYLVAKRTTIEYISQREGMAIVALSWTIIGLFGGLPFYFGGAGSGFTDAFFESVSGFTTTGSSILTNIEGVSPSLLFWRSLIQWLGGMGIIVLSLAILPFLGVGGMQLFKAEVPSPVPDKLTPRLTDSAKILWYVYILISALEVILLLFGGMNFYDALCHTLTTMPTGGFSTKNASVAHYSSAYIDYVIVIFMLLAGINFSLHYQMLRGKTLIFWRDSECRFFMFLCLGFTFLIAFDIYGSVYDTIGKAFQYASFQVVSLVTTTGYATADYEKWPGLSQVLLFLCMFIGASAGSTGGGMKCARIMVAFKYCYREIFTLIHPSSVSQVKMNGAVIPNHVLRSIMGFLALYIGIFVICSIAVAAMGVDMVTAFSSVAACIGNIGPGFGDVGPVDNFAIMPCAAKWLLAWCMLLGRLEIYTVIIMFVPEFWKK
ncbi:Trk system potassium uptake protein trkH [Desulfamplus magnetovallimortis]|uniref:Trk system potassium uptake protein trkH n=1 Tax=Desulfamplus magnetovallimortis TaxID=1246637 RepID=A0A1W1HA14_9BACT|nr:potassium transporter TrkG [Desulfamplus magnetovallimortis]SLM29334.1 Trk system potassium uptake protein trkH [Desulfamplus magnetovallimortis]